MGDGQFEYDVAVVGGCGHVGLPLGIAFATRGLNVALYDISDQAVSVVSSGNVPFEEPGTTEALRSVLGRNLVASTSPDTIGKARNIVVVIGTPVDEHQNPEPHKVVLAIEAFLPYLREGQALVLRSTVYPGTTKLVEELLARSGLAIPVAFCPERIAEGKAMVELFELPQIISSRSPVGLKASRELFESITTKIVVLEPEEAELAKLFTNTWRYFKFAAANQLFMMAQNFGLSYEKIRKGLSEDYPRASDLPKSGFAAGPCLLKDTLQLAAFNNNDFALGLASVTINEGFPLYLTHRLEQRYSIADKTVGILGMAFKGESDDIRSSLAYKLRRILRYKAADVIAADPYVKGDNTLATEGEVIERADIIIIGAPHMRYRDITTSKPVIDVWALLGEESGL